MDKADETIESYLADACTLREIMGFASAWLHDCCERDASQIDYIITATAERYGCTPPHSKLMEDRKDG
jgi:hypothetical protein